MKYCEGWKSQCARPTPSSHKKSGLEDLWGLTNTWMLLICDCQGNRGTIANTHFPHLCFSLQRCVKFWGFLQIICFIFTSQTCLLGCEIFTWSEMCILCDRNSLTFWETCLLAVFLPLLPRGLAVKSIPLLYHIDSTSIPRSPGRLSLTPTLESLRRDWHLQLTVLTQSFD